MGSRCLLLDSVDVRGSGLTLGDNVFVNAGVFLDARGSISIGDGVSIGMRTAVLSASHSIGPSRQRAGAVILHETRIGDGVWLGANVTVLPGITIGAGAVVGAGSVVTKNVPADTLVAGVPARIVRSLD